MSVDHARGARGRSSRRRTHDSGRNGHRRIPVPIDRRHPAGVFNASLDGKVRRAIDIREGEAVDEDAFKALIHSAVALNRSRAR